MVREELAKYLNSKPCPECDGTRLRREARHVKVGRPDERAIFEISNWPLKETGEFFGKLQLEGQRQAIADKIVKEIVSRLQFLNNVGLDYLSLDRSAETLSGGEAQRIRLASQIGSGLTGVMYVLDEPSIGLHQRDNDRLLDDAQAPARSGQQRDRRRARHRRDPVGRSRRRHGSGRRRAWRPDRRAGDARRDPPRAALADRAVPGRASADPDAGAAATGRPETRAERHRRHGQQPEEHHAELARGSVRLRDRRVGIGQVDADQRYALPGGRAAPVQQHRRAGAVRRKCTVSSTTTR